MSLVPDITEVPEHMWPRHHVHGWRCCGMSGSCRVLGPGVHPPVRRSWRSIVRNLLR